MTRRCKFTWPRPPRHRQSRSFCPPCSSAEVWASGLNEVARNVSKSFTEGRSTSSEASYKALSPPDGCSGGAGRQGLPRCPSTLPNHEPRMFQRHWQQPSDLKGRAWQTRHHHMELMEPASSVGITSLSLHYSQLFLGSRARSAVLEAIRLASRPASKNFEMAFTRDALLRGPHLLKGRLFEPLHHARQEVPTFQIH